MKQLTKPNRRPVINRIVQGEELTKMLPALPVIGYVAHVVTHGSLYKPIDGPVFGARVATYNKILLRRPYLLRPLRTRRRRSRCMRAGQPMAFDARLWSTMLLMVPLKAVLKTVPNMLLQCFVKSKTRPVNITNLNAIKV